MRKGDESRKRIIETGSIMFARRGYENTSLQDILNATGMSKGGFYHYFSTKAALLNAVYEIKIEDWYSERMQQIDKMSAKPEQKLNMVLDMLFSLNRESPRLPALLSKLSIEDEDAGIKQAVKNITIDKVAPFVAGILEVGNESKTFYVKKPNETAYLICTIALEANEAAISILTKEKATSEAIERVIDLVTVCRESIEKIIYAPYASLTLVNTPDIINVIRSVFE